jgi:hypothetical protein
VRKALAWALAAASQSIRIATRIGSAGLYGAGLAARSLRTASGTLAAVSRRASRASGLVRWSGSTACFTQAVRAAGNCARTSSHIAASPWARTSGTPQWPAKRASMPISPTLCPLMRKSAHSSVQV